jgi:predicted metal-dependent phosphoesterase TrpH
LIDLHTHTTASDGGLSPSDLVARASAAGLTVLSVTDHDTLAGCGPAASACAAVGIEFVTGIEITAIRDDRDVHTLGYFVDAASPGLARFLAAQRQLRIDRIREMIARLARFGIELDADRILQPARDDESKSAGRPWIARALVAGGYVKNSDEAFARWLSRDGAAFVTRPGASPEEVIGRIHDAGGITSIAHPGQLRRDEWLPGLAGAGLDAIEAYHPDHNPAATAKYLSLADRLGIAVTGGSDYHADPVHGAALGGVTLPRDRYERLKSLVRSA